MTSSPFICLYICLLIPPTVSAGTILISEHQLMLPSHFSSIKMLRFTHTSTNTLNFLLVFLSVNNHVIFSILPELRIFPISFLSLKGDTEQHWGSKSHPSVVAFN